MRWQWMFWNEFPPRRVELSAIQGCEHEVCYIVFGERFFTLDGARYRTHLHCWNCAVVSLLPRTWEHVGYTV